MSRFTRCLVAASAVLLAGALALAAPLDLERLYRDPRPFGIPPRLVRWAPAGTVRLAFLWNDRGVKARDLWTWAPGEAAPRLVVDHRRLAAGPVHDEAVEELRETARLDDRGIDGYAWSPDGTRLLLSYGGDLFVVDPEGRHLHRLTRTAAPEIDPQWFPDGRRVGFVRDNDLWVLGVDDGSLVQLTSDGGETLLNGRPDYIALEELGFRSAWAPSPGGKLVAFVRYDTSPVELLSICDAVGERVRCRHQRRPPAGTANSRLRVGIVPATGGPVTWADLAAFDDFYVTHLRWLAPGRLLVGIEPRDLHSLHLLEVHPDGSTRELHVERDEAWINLARSFLATTPGGRVLLGSERTGAAQLWLLDPAGGGMLQVTRGNREVTSLQGVVGDHVVFLGHLDSPHEQHLYRVPLRGGAPERLTPQPGWHEARLSPDGRWVASVRSDWTLPPDLWVGPPGTGERGWVRLTRSPPPDFDPAELVAPRIVHVRGRDGVPVPALLWEPPGPPPRGGRAAIVHVHGGGYAQAVRRAFLWSTPLHTLMVREGWAVLSIDYRGSEGYGRSWRTAVHLDLGGPDLADTVAAADWLAAHVPGVDRRRIGLWGWSYGGFLAALAAGKAPGAFAAHVAVAPVTEWEHYDTHYTEERLGLPAEHPDAYRRADPLTYAARVNAPLLLIHGLRDDNVHCQDTFRLADALVRAGRPFDMMIYPTGKHGIRRDASRVHLFRKMFAFFREHLGGHER